MTLQEAPCRISSGRDEQRAMGCKWKWGGAEGEGMRGQPCRTIINFGLLCYARITVPPSFVFLSALITRIALALLQDSAYTSRSSQQMEELCLSRCPPLPSLPLSLHASRVLTLTQVLSLPLFSLAVSTNPSVWIEYGRQCGARAQSGAYIESDYHFCYIVIFQSFSKI